MTKTKPTLNNLNRANAGAAKGAARDNNLAGSVNNLKTGNKLRQTENNAGDVTALTSQLDDEIKN